MGEEKGTLKDIHGGISIISQAEKKYSWVGLLGLAKVKREAGFDAHVHLGFVTFPENQHLENLEDAMHYGIMSCNHSVLP